MSSYKVHSVFAFIFSFFLFLNPFSMVLAIVGANLPDYDHKVNHSKIQKMIIIGLLLCIVLYFLNLPYYVGLIIILIAIIFYFSNHRGFTHSIVGAIVFSFLLSLLFLFFYQLVFYQLSFNQFLNLNVFYGINIADIIFSIFILFLVYIFVNKKLFIPILLLYLIGIIVFPIFSIFSFSNTFNTFNNISYNIIPNISYNIIPNIDFMNIFGNSFFLFVMIFLSIFFGIFSHSVLDSFSQKGVEVLRPFSSKKFHKSFGLLFVLIFILLSLLNVIFLAINHSNIIFLIF
ncbi:MAG: metal-dependent hydrolase [Methanobrevibacter sp.]|jgi:inner membrane protein|nr:metal-dependent hydrolase [Candidatus Methanoflexus mossambicus]